MVPLPAEPYDSLPGLALAWAMSSFRSLTGTDGCTTIEVVETHRMAIGWKSLIGSYGTFAMVIGLSTMVLVLPSRIVWPSGWVRATSPVAMVPLPPPWFST
jgi:hypothetical protein